MLRHPKKRGEWAEMKFMARAAAHSLNVSKPWGDCSRYDFIVEYKGSFKRVQVKSTFAYRGKDSGYTCKLRPKYERNDFEFLAAYVIPEDVWYIVPMEEIVARKALGLAPQRSNNKFRFYMEAWHLLRRRNAGARK